LVCRAVGAKANVLQSVGFVRWVATLLILPKRWVVYSFACLLNLARSFVRVTANGSGIAEGGEIEAQNLN